MNRLNPEHERRLKALFDSGAIQKFEDNRKLELSFLDACRFWGLTENMKAKQLDEKLEEMDQALFELYLITANVDAETSSARVVTAADIRSITDIHRYLQYRFKRHLKLLRRRG